MFRCSRQSATDQDVALDVRFDRSSARAGATVTVQVGYTTRPQGDRALAPPNP